MMQKGKKNEEEEKKKPGSVQRTCFLTKMSIKWLKSPLREGVEASSLEIFKTSLEKAVLSTGREEMEKMSS